MHKRRGGLPLPASLVFRKKSSLFSHLANVQQAGPQLGQPNPFPLFNAVQWEVGREISATNSHVVTSSTPMRAEEGEISHHLLFCLTAFASLHCSLALFLGAAAARSCPLLPCPVWRLADSPTRRRWATAAACCSAQKLLHLWEGRCRCITEIILSSQSQIWSGLCEALPFLVWFQTHRCSWKLDVTFMFFNTCHPLNIQITIFKFDA